MVVSQKTCIAVYASRKATASTLASMAQATPQSIWLKFTPYGSHPLLLYPSERSGSLPRSHRCMFSEDREL